MRRGRRAAAALLRSAPYLVIAACAVIGVLAALLLAGCTATGASGTSGAGRTSRPAAGPGRPRAVVGKAVISGRGPGGAFFIIGPRALAGAVALGGTGVSGGGTRPQISVPPIPPASSAQDIAMPLDSYEQVASQEQDTLAAAANLLTQQCMQAKGFSYPVAAQAGPGTAAVLQSIEEGAYGVTSLAQAETYGYGQPGQNSGPGIGGAAVPEFIQELQQHGSAWTSALLGFVPGARASAPQHQGCLQRANSELYGPINGSPNPDPVPGLAVAAAQWTQSDPRILAVEREWSACMARRGFDDKTPAQPLGHNWPATPTPIEIATAEADVACKVATNLPNTWLTVEAAYQQALITQNLTALSQLQANFGALLRRAEDLLLIPAAGGNLPVSRAPP